MCLFAKSFILFNDVIYDCFTFFIEAPLILLRARGVYLIFELISTLSFFFMTRMFFFPTSPQKDEFIVMYKVLIPYEVKLSLVYPFGLYSIVEYEVRKGVVHTCYLSETSQRINYFFVLTIFSRKLRGN